MYMYVDYIPHKTLKKVSFIETVSGSDVRFYNTFFWNTMMLQLPVSVTPALQDCRTHLKTLTFGLYCFFNILTNTGGQLSGTICSVSSFWKSHKIWLTKKSWELASYYLIAKIQAISYLNWSNKACTPTYSTVDLKDVILMLGNSTTVPPAPLLLLLFCWWNWGEERLAGL